MRKNWQFWFMFVVCSLLVFFSENLKAAEFDYTGGSVSETYDNVVVNSFSYDYTTKFTAKTGFYNGQEIYDGGKVVSETQTFYTAKSIKVNVNHVDKIFGKDDDKTVIYKYNETRKDFNAKMAGGEFVNKSGVFTLDSEGLYKIVYVFEGSQKYSNYVYITHSINHGVIVDDNRYDNTSAYAKFSFKLNLSDAYDLRGNSYYYAFGNNVDALNYTSFNLFTNDEKSASKAVTSIKNREVSVDVLDEYVSEEKQYFFLKINNGLKDTVLVSEDKFSLVHNLMAHFVLLNGENNQIESGAVLKQNDKVKIKILFNAPVTFVNLQISIDGGNKFFNLSDSEIAVSEVVYEYQIKAEDFTDKSFLGSVVLKTKNSSNAIVKHEDVNITVKGVNETPFKIDMVAPIIENIVSEPASTGSAIARQYDVKVQVKEDNLVHFYFYAKKCNVVQEGNCFDGFDMEEVTLVEVSKDVMTFSEDGSVEVPLVIDEKFGKYNGEGIYLFVKAVDAAGNEVVQNKLFKVDNIINTFENADMLFNVTNLIVEGNLVGKNLNIVTLAEDKVSKVSVQLNESEMLECGFSTPLELDGRNVLYFPCLSYQLPFFEYDVTIELVDIYNNIETYTSVFKHREMVDGNAKIGNLMFKTHESEFYEASIDLYNEMANENFRVVFDESVISGLDVLLRFSAFENLSGLVKSLVLKNGEEEIVLVENIAETLTLPTTEYVLSRIGHIEEYKTCAISDNKCNIDLFIKYEYVLGDEIHQNRYVRVGLLDNNHKFKIEDFNSEFVVEVKQSFAGVSYTMIDNMNNAINSDSVQKTIKIIFVNKNGEEVAVNSIDTSKVGTYKVSEMYMYNSISSFPLNYSISVVDTVAPIIRLNGNSTFKIKEGKDLPDYNSFVTYSDNYDSELTLQHEISPTYDGKVGEYEVSFWVVDSSGNSSEKITMKLIVEESGKLTTYLIVGGIILVVLCIVGFFTIREIKKEKRSN